MELTVTLDDIKATRSDALSSVAKYREQSYTLRESVKNTDPSEGRLEAEALAQSFDNAAAHLDNAARELTSLAGAIALDEK